MSKKNVKIKLKVDKNAKQKDYYLSGSELFVVTVAVIGIAGRTMAQAMSSLEIKFNSKN